MTTLDAAGMVRPTWEDYSKCIHCGLCLNACPTYRLLGVEPDSPRGRIHQMILVEEGRLKLGDSFVRHIDLCLDCRACETASPSGVQYGKLVEAARAPIEQPHRRPPRYRQPLPVPIPGCRACNRSAMKQKLP